MQRMRNPNLDLIRCVAVLSVVSVHFFLNTGFYSTPVIGERMYIMVGMVSLFLICVPLFVLLTGFLMCKKELSHGYYKGIIYTISIYVLSSAFCILYKYVVMKQEISVTYCVREILNFTGAPYAWYIEMYIGLYLLIPFLNILYNSMETNKNKQILIVTFYCLITLPTIFNAFDIKIIPSWWANMWPLLYYFIGCYLNESKDLVKKYSNFKILVMLFGILLVSIGVNILKSNGKTFVWGSHNEWYSWGPLGCSVLIFILIMKIDLSGIPKWLNMVAQKISKLALGIYLNSWIMDQIIYAQLNTRITNMTDRLNYFPLVVFCVFFGSLCTAFLVDIIYKFFLFVVRYTRSNKGD